MIISLVGTNWFGVKSELEKLASTFVHEHGDLALERIDAGDVSYEQILGAIESLPFLASKKMVVLSELSTNKDASEKLDKLIERAGDTTDLVILESKLDKRSVYYKQLKKLTEFHEYNELDEQAMANWLVDQARASGAVMGVGDARYLVQRVGINQTALSHELEKLALYDSKISRQTIDLLTDEAPSSTIFNLIDRVFAGQLDKALKLYDEQRAQKVEPQAMHAMLVWQMHVVALCANAKGKSSQQIASDAGLSPFVVQKSQAIASRMGNQKISEFLDLLTEIDRRSKSQTLDYDEALRYAITTLAK